MASKQAFGEICYGEKFDDKGVLIPKEVEKNPLTLLTSYAIFAYIKGK